MIRYFILTYTAIILSNLLQAQEKAYISGRVTDQNNEALELVNVTIQGTTTGTTTDRNGRFQLTVPANTDFILAFSFVGYLKASHPYRLQPGERKQHDQTLFSTSTQIPTFEYKARDERATITRIDPREAEFIPSTSGNAIEELIKKTGLGVFSNNELSSQYSVRGGNFDENLVYVNDIEIYRPQLIRSGQQEGLSFVNPDLTGSVLFSSGGFDARYGDKLSSVLDIQYKRPRRNGGSIMLSLLGLSGHVEAVSKNNRFTFLLGARQKSNQYLLNALQTKGQYKPSFTDVQLYTTYQINEKLEISMLGNYSRNKYMVVPESRETEFGTVKESYQLKVFFDGREEDYINTWLGALTLTYRPRPNLMWKWITSGYQTRETQTLDVNGQYMIGRLEADFGKEDFGEMKEVLGVGTHFQHARDELYITVANTEMRGGYTRKRSYLQWGAKYQIELIDDRLKEWEMIDSAGFTLPHPHDSVGYQKPWLQPENPLLLQDVISSRVNMTGNRVSGFIQNAWTFNPDSSELTLTAGIRAVYWDINKQLCISPRLTLAFAPDWKQDIVFRFSTGLYYQPPFYKELRDFNGNLNTSLKAQRSIHVVLGSDWNFKIWERPFKFVTEVYYKYLDNLIPYEIDNVRIQYFATNNAKGYATGVDFKINGEFVKGDESWLGLSFMQTREDILDDYYYDYYNSDGEKIISGFTRNNIPVDSIRREPGYIPRPTDQLMNINVFFQDHIPRVPTLKMHLNLVYSTPLPFGPPERKRYMDTLRMPAYFRVDIGFSKSLISEASPLPRKNPFHFIKSLWISAEVYNLLGRLNTISYLWVKDINNRQYAVPNELTKRLINVKLVARF